MLLSPNLFHRHWMTYVEVLEGKRSTPPRSMLMVFSALSLFYVLLCSFNLLGNVMPTYRVTSEWWVLFLQAGVFPEARRTNFTIALLVYVLSSLLGVGFELIQSRKQAPPFMSIFTAKGRQQLSLANQRKFELIIGRCFPFIKHNFILLQMMSCLLYVTCGFVLSDAWLIDIRLCLFWIFMGVTINISCAYGEFHQFF